MRRTCSRQLLSTAGWLSLLALCLLPTPSALAGGCCFAKIVITNLDTGRQVSITGPALTAGYDLSTFGSFADFPNRTAAPARTGPAYEVDRDGWDHLRYYPGLDGMPGAVYYEGLYNGSSEYDRQWFVVTPAQDGALRQVLAAQGLTAGAAPQTLARIVSGLVIAGLLLASVSLWIFPWHYSRRRANAWAARQH